MSTKSNEEILTKAHRVRCVIFDVDGVLTDGSICITNNGEEYKIFHVHDGLGIKLLQMTGVIVAIISSRSSDAVTYRMQDLDVKYIYQNQPNKLFAFEKFLSELNLSPEQVAYVGDDLPDLPILTRVGLGITVPNAHPLILKTAHWQTTASGGKGAAREVCELIMQAQDTLMDIYKKFSH